MKQVAPIAVSVVLFVLSGSAELAAQDEAFPAGIEGEIYYCPRIDILPADQGGPLEIELDGELDDSVWKRAVWHSWTNPANALPLGDTADSPEEDLQFEWAAVSDLDFIYVAWRIVDDLKQNQESFQCNAWQDDSIEIYVDANNDGPDCTGSDEHCYGTDDAQITVGLENDGLNDPDLLVFGGVAGGPACDFSGPHPELARGVVREVLDDEAEYAGWQAEISIALETIGNSDDGTPQWLIEPEHGKIIGWNMHGQDDDDGADRDHKLMWSAREVTESAWRNPAAFGKLVFVDLSEELPEFTSAVRDVACERNADGSVSVTWTNPEDANLERAIRIEVDGQEVAQVPGTSESAELAEADVPLDGTDHTIAVLNSGNQAGLCVVLQSPFDDCGGIRTWNILGAFGNPGGAAPGDDAIRLDYLTDGDTTELDFVWFPGAAIETDFGNTAASTGVLGGTAGRNPGGVPAVFPRNGVGARVFFESSSVFGGELDQVMAYAQVYVIADEDMVVSLGMTSDDSIQVLLNGEEVWINSVPRGGASACQPQDVAPDGIIFIDPIVLEKGYNSLIVKIFQGGGAWDFALRFQDFDGQPITKGLSTSLFPEGACSVPPVAVARSVDTGETALVECQEVPKWSPGGIYDVSLALTQIRGAVSDEDCLDPPGPVTIAETVPEGWTPTGASDGGSIQGGTITWVLEGAGLAERTLTYQVEAGGERGDANFAGRISEAGSILSFGIGGAGLLSNPTDFNEEGFVKTMLLLGPFSRRVSFLEPGPNPGDDAIRRDYLTDGEDITETDVEPRAGDTVNTDFGGAAASTGLAASPNPINPGGVPAWKEWRDVDDTINFTTYYGADLNNIMMYAVFYAVAEDDMTVGIGLSSDDSVQVLVNGLEVWINNVPRAAGPANQVLDTVSPVDLSRGLNLVMVKVFEGIGDHSFRLRFQDPLTGDPLTEGISICLSPDPEECGAKVDLGTRFVRGDVDASGVINITDAVFLLNFLFAGGPTPPCIDAADVDNAGLNLPNITDAVFVLNWLFQGGPEPPPPSPGTAAYGRDACGADPEGDTDGIGCEAFAPCV